MIGLFYMNSDMGSYASFDMLDADEFADYKLGKMN